MASAATEPVQGAWEKGPVFLELLRMATALVPHPLPLASHPVLPSPPSGPEHRVLDLDTAVKWLERSSGHLGASEEVVSTRRFS